ncbi:MAG: biotin synthase BioB [Candidatus Thermoplasmatota archaeon]|jgi:biotin synthase|nr:biotin synthase BioB [Candidatus Thermoplasmatota archaeon]
MNSFISGILEKGLGGEGITREEALTITDLEGEDHWDLYYAAGKIARKFRGKEISLCTIVNARSGLCSEDCKFCSQSSHYTTDVDTYDILSTESIVEAARAMDKTGADRFGIVTSGKGVGPKEMGAILEAVSSIRKTTGLEVCASLGVMSYEHLLRLKDAGLASYHHNIETAPSFYSKICSTHPYEDRARTVRNAKRAGLSVCCGGIIGMGESWSDRVEMAFTLKELDPDSIPINILNPVKGTPFENRPMTPPLEVLKTISLFRFVNPTKSIRYAGGRERNMKELQALGLVAGLDGMLTGNYLTITGSKPDDDKRMVRNLGLSLKRG